MKNILFFLCVFFANAQTKIATNHNYQVVLNKNIENKTFIYGKWNEKDGTETHLTYLGKVKTKKGKTFKIMTSIWYWGKSHRATSRILVFNDQNQYYGNYCLGMTYEIPDKLENGNLIFKYNKGETCDKESKTIIDFKNGLPNQIFIKCKNGMGDFYNLNIEK
jgi:hypothetical protein